MRTVRNNNRTENSFEQGIKQIVSEKAARPTEYADYELNAIMRREQYETTRTSVNAPGRGYSISDMMQELAWSTPVASTQTR